MTNRIVNMDWIRDHLHKPNVVIADCRFILGQPEAGQQAYEREHIPTTSYFDLEKDLSAPIVQHGGRHPLPVISKFVQVLEAAGIDNSTHVIAYDDQDGSMAARLWWLLTYLGHQNVSVMDGNYSDWKKAGYPITNEHYQPKPATFVPNVQSQMVVSMEEVKQKLTQTDTVIIDSREEKRYLGEFEPLDPVAGHIPNAIHSFWKEVKDEKGKYKSPDQLRNHFDSLPPTDEIIVYCGSGVTATPNVLALQEAGASNVKLYIGSWSDWISYPENPVAKEKNE